MKRSLLYDLLFVALLLVAAYLRLTGFDWGESTHLHPDERFLSLVESAMRPVSSLGEYFDTPNSTLNPNNVGHTFFVYGTLPIFVVRYLAEWILQLGGESYQFISGYDQVHWVGRVLSALADLGVVALVYLIAARLFGRRVGLLAAAFSTFTVMQIQQSHFFTVDNFLNFFIWLAILFAVRIAGSDPQEQTKEGELPRLNLPDFLLFGLALGMAVSSKISAAPLALLLPLALFVNLWRADPEAREPLLGRGVLYLAGAALVSLLAFRVFQPYAFSGPGFFDIGLNPAWMDTMRSLQAQVTGDVDWPPSMQWARRPIWFAAQNMTLWGMGLPLALVSWGGFAWAGWRFYKSDWRVPAFLAWAWAAAYLLWQSLAFNPTMRYLLPVYPALAIFGAWGLFQLWDWGGQGGAAVRLQRFARPAALLFGAVGVAGAAIWAFAFVHIYQTPITRVEAARWIYQNIPGPITLAIQGDEGIYNQPLPYRQDAVLDAERPYFTSFVPRRGGSLEAVSLHHLLSPISLELRLGEAPDSPIAAQQSEIVDLEALEAGESFELVLNVPQNLGGIQYLTIDLAPGTGQLALNGVDLANSENLEAATQSILGESIELSMGEESLIPLEMGEGVTSDQMRLRFRVLTPIRFSPLEVQVRLSLTPEMDAVMAAGSAAISPSGDPVALAEATGFTFDPVPVLEEGQQYYLEISTHSENALALMGSAIVNEGSWDDGLPLRIDGYDGFGGIYQEGLNMEMYWDEDEAKLERFLNNLERGEYLFFTSSRQWGSLPRIPERFPLSTEYYRLMLGCPDGRSIEWCYNVAQVGTFEGQLGYELIRVFDSSPQLGPLVINDQAAEEAFTVYDHPKVFIFKKEDDYDHAQVTALLSAVDLDSVLHLTPKQAAGGIPPTLMLPEDRWDSQRASGTWSSIFDTDAWVNASPWLSALAWYLALGLLGLGVFPLLRAALPGLKDGGYPFARLAGLLLLSYFGWLGASLGLSFTRGWLAAVAGSMILAGLLVGYRHREALRDLWVRKRAYLLRTELLFLGFFLLMLVIRWANPDLWHPAKGGEKPMDFAYFNAVLKSTSFPPYDPWFAGGYINYYYYGFVLVGSLTKLLGVVPTVAYNLILPALFAMLAMGAYSLAWNLFSAWRERTGARGLISPHLAGLFAAAGTVLLGNLGNIQMILVGYQRLGAEGAFIAEASFFTKLLWGLRGFVANLLGEPLPYGLGDWYWNPTRIIPAPGETAPITEFPLFTFTYADLHAHMIALPLTLLALAWALSVVLSRAWQGRRSLPGLLWSFAFAGIVVGSLRPTNTWDFPTYLALPALAVAYAIWRYAPLGGEEDASARPNWLFVLGAPALLAALSLLAYQPYAEWYRQPYTILDPWRGTHTPTSVYLLHWGVFLFFIVAWMIWETRQWMAQTPLASLRKLEPYRPLIWGSAFFVLSAIVASISFDIRIGWLVLPLMVWAGLLILRPGQAEEKRLTLFLIGTGLFLSLLVETVVLRGDISRMNTVFKFYMQVWVLFALGAALALAWLLGELRAWLPGWRFAWSAASIALVASAALFLLLGVSAKIRDRMVAEAPRTLDGMAYMQYATYADRDVDMQLAQDYEAIRWMQENVAGSPVIVEGHSGEYRWGSRYSIYTGLPSVIGWNWHQRQQREFVPGNDIWGRVGEVQQFYETTDLAIARDFLRRHQVEYIIVGQMEQAYYPGPGLDKFETQEGLLWDRVYQAGDTAIYRVNEGALARE